MKVGIDIGGSHIAVGIVDKHGNVLEKIETDINKCENICEYIVNYVDSAISKLSKDGDIEHIGIVSPGNPKGSKIYNLVNLGIKEIDFKSLEEKYGITIKSINDAKAAAIAEKTYGNMNGYQDSAFLCLGTGIGGAIFLNDMLLQSNRNPGFELGHMVIDKDGIQCNCGKRGCFETLCSIKRFKDKIIDLLSKEENGIYEKSSEDLVAILEKNIEKDEIQKLVNEYIENLIIGLSNIIDIFEPQVIVLGGSFVYFKEILFKKLIVQMEERRYVFNKEKLPKIELAKLKNDAGIIGATLIEE